MKARPIILCVLIALAFDSSEGKESAESPADQCVAVWYDKKQKRYAVAVDLSFGYIPPDGQLNFGSLDELKKYLDRQLGESRQISQKSEGTVPMQASRAALTMINQCPSGNWDGRTRMLNQVEAALLRRSRPNWVVPD